MSTRVSAHDPPVGSTKNLVTEWSRAASSLYVDVKMSVGSVYTVSQPPVGWSRLLKVWSAPRPPPRPGHCLQPAGDAEAWSSQACWSGLHLSTVPAWGGLLGDLGRQRPRAASWG